MKPSLPIIRHIKIAALQVKDTCARLLLGISDERSVISPPHPFRTIRSSDMRYFILTLFIAFFPAGVRGTTIVIHKTATDIFVGADSKEIHLTGEPDTLTNKIVELKPSYYFAAAGNVIRVGSNSIFFSLISFDVVTSAKACASKSTGLRVVADTCSERLNVELEIPLLTLKDQRPDLYKSKIANQAILELAFFGIEGGGLSVYSRDILPYLFLETPVTYVKPADCEANCTAHFELGLYDIIGPLLAAQPNYWEIGEDKAICSLIKMEIEAHPESVGWPVKVFHLSSNGTSEWFTHENSCEEEKKAEPVTETLPKAASPQAPKPAPKPKHKPRQRHSRKRH